MSFTIPSVVRSLGRHLAPLAGIAALLLSPGPSAVLAATLTLEEPRYVIGFEELALGSTLAAAGWTQSGAAQYVVATPRRPGENASTRVVQLPGTTDRHITMSPAVTLNPSYAAGETIYFSAWISKASSASSGGQVQLMAKGEISDSFASFGVGDTSENQRKLRLYDGANIHWSAVTLENNYWYELVLVVEMNEADPSQSLGSLYYRRIMSSATVLEPVADLQKIRMAGFTATGNPALFEAFRLQGRNEVQFDRLATGYAVIPEPGSVSMLLLGGGVFGLLRRLK